jgi:hypothetical protein
VAGNGVAKLPDQFLPSFFSHLWLKPINDSNVFRFCILISGGGFLHEFSNSLHAVAQKLRFFLVLIDPTGITASFGPFAHTDALTLL